jgi:hypothetical protein
MGLANSGTSAESNMEPHWVDAPDLLPNSVDIWNQCELFFICSKFVAAGSQFLWTYPIVFKVWRGVRLFVHFVFVSVYFFPVAPNCSSPQTSSSGDSKESKTGTNSECECVCVALFVQYLAHVIKLS